MSTRFGGLVPRGMVAGVVGATAMAFWFLIIDGSEGEPFRTPAFLAGAILGTGDISRSLGPVFFYTLIHYTAFIAVGLLLSWTLSKMYTAPNVFLGLVLGFALFDIVFYTSVSVTGVDVIAELGWPAVVAGNLIAGVTLMGFLHLTSATPPVSWWALLDEHRMMKEGLVSGLIGAGVVALWFLIIDMGRGQPFFTPGALWSALFLGSTDLDAVSVSSATVMGYTIVHIGAFIATGFVAAAIACYAEDTPPLILAGIGLRGVLHGPHGAGRRVPPRSSGVVGHRRGQRVGLGLHGVLPVGQAPEAAAGPCGEPAEQNGLTAIGPATVP